MEQLDALRARLDAVGFSPQELDAILQTLVENKTHSQNAARTGIKRTSSKMSLYRARKRAAKFGIVIPSAKPRKRDVRPMVQMSTVDGIV